MGSVVPFRDPSKALAGAPRAEAIKRLRVAMPEIAGEALERAFGGALKEVTKIGFGTLSVDDVVPMIMKALRHQVRRRR